MITSIWNTPEAEAWARDFDYNDYLKHFSKFNSTSGPVKIQVYYKFCEAFELALELGIGDEDHLQMFKDYCDNKYAK